MHQQGNNVVLACCDKELVGKTISDEEREIVLTEYFYKGKIVSEKTLAQKMMGANSLNLFGEKAISVAIKQGFISEKEVIKISGVKHAIIFRI